MKFLIDVNASGSVATWLIDQGHDVAFVSAKDPRMPDEEILKWAVSEQRIIVTTDKDFEEMIWHQGKKHCGVLRLENLPRQQRLTLLRDAMNLYAGELESGAIVIAYSYKYRIRHPD
ncbi:MAG: hypothetical protein DRG63_02420 [Deltaproteobacteria bacterium]|nr:MAG: hypothetical protein DRG63_02420 [Deltaproteobacteria bacterium]RLB20845.1 MAG: hypothetical protein DRG76_10215 [Deltaproteobacteria bacterium]